MDEWQLLILLVLAIPVVAIVALRLDDEGKEDELRRAAALADLSGGWRDHFRKRLAER